MLKSRDELICMLDQLAADMPDMIDKNPDSGDFWAAFAGQADHIEDSAGEADCAFVHDRIDAILISHGLSPSGPEEPEGLEAANEIEPTHELAGRTSPANS